MGESVYLAELRRLRARVAELERDQAPSRRGFGSKLIEQTLPYELGGEVVLDFPRTGVRCEFVLTVREGLL